MILLLLGKNGKENLPREEAGRPVRRLEQFSRVDTMVVCPKIVTVGVVRSGCIWQICQS